MHELEFPTTWSIWREAFIRFILWLHVHYLLFFTSTATAFGTSEWTCCKFDFEGQVSPRQYATARLRLIVEELYQDVLRLT
jgi:hypothetical protein